MEHIINQLRKNSPTVAMAASLSVRAAATGETFVTRTGSHYELADRVGSRLAAGAGDMVVVRNGEPWALVDTVLVVETDGICYLAGGPQHEDDGEGEYFSTTRIVSS